MVSEQLNFFKVHGGIRAFIVSVIVTILFLYHIIAVSRLPVPAVRVFADVKPHTRGTKRL